MNSGNSDLSSPKETKISEIIIPKRMIVGTKYPLYLVRKLCLSIFWYNAS